MKSVPLISIERTQQTGASSAARPRLPAWFKVKLQIGQQYQHIRRVLDEQGLHTICEEARCPNVWECWNHGTATFLILGDVCTRRCHYCSVSTGRPAAVDSEEPGRIAQAVQALKLRHVVITSVNRDDLPDGGAGIFAQTIAAVRRVVPACTIEVLIPDFQGESASVATVMGESPDILNHNVETVPRLFPSVRPQGKYQRSLTVLTQAKQFSARTKSGLMVGMGETPEEVMEVMGDLRSVHCDILSIGQYLQPTKQHRPVSRYYAPDEFEAFKELGLALGFRHVESGPLVRSSYHAEQQVV